MRILLFAGAAGLLAMLSSHRAVAEAERPLVVRVQRVAYGDLDLTTAAGADAMLRRLDRAASRACGGRPSRSANDPLSAAKSRDFRHCKVSAIDVATLHLDAPLVRTAWLRRDEADVVAEARRASAALLRQTGTDIPPETVRN